MCRCTAEAGSGPAYVGMSHRMHPCRRCRLPRLPGDSSRITPPTSPPDPPTPHSAFAFGDLRPSPQIVYARWDTTNSNATTANQTQGTMITGAQYAVTLPYASGTFTPPAAGTKAPFNLSVSAAASTCAAAPGAPCTYAWGVRPQGSGSAFTEIVRRNETNDFGGAASLNLDAGSGLTRVRPLAGSAVRTRPLPRARSPAGSMSPHAPGPQPGTGACVAVRRVVRLARTTGQLRVPTRQRCLVPATTLSTCMPADAAADAGPSEQRRGAPVATDRDRLFRWQPAGGHSDRHSHGVCGLGHRGAGCAVVLHCSRKQPLPA